MRPVYPLSGLVASGFAALGDLDKLAIDNRRWGRVAPLVLQVGHDGSGQPERNTSEMAYTTSRIGQVHGRL